MLGLWFLDSPQRRKPEWTLLSQLKAPPPARLASCVCQQDKVQGTGLLWKNCIYTHPKARLTCYTSQSLQALHRSTTPRQPNRSLQEAESFVWSRQTWDHRNGEGVRYATTVSVCWWAMPRRHNTSKNLWHHGDDVLCADPADSSRHPSLWPLQCCP